MHDSSWPSMTEDSKRRRYGWRNSTEFPYELCKKVILHYLGAEHATQYSYAKKQLHDRYAQEMASRRN